MNLERGEIYPLNTDFDKILVNSNSIALCYDMNIEEVEILEANDEEIRIFEEMIRI